MTWEKGKLGVMKLHNQNLKVPYVKVHILGQSRDRAQGQPESPL